MSGTNLSTPQGRMMVALPGVSKEEYTVTPTQGIGDVCGPLLKRYLLGVSVVPCLVAVENLIFLFAVLAYRTKLKHNNVYTYVTSALMANVLTSLWAFYHFLNYYHGIESSKPTFWWAFRKGMTAGFSLILCGNIGLLIYAIEDNTYMLGRLVSGTITTRRSNNRLTRKARWKKSLLLITFAWILPVGFGLLSMTPWNCTSDCTCTLYLSSGAPLCKGSRCSRLYTPMAKTYLLVIVVIWFLECAFLLYVLCKSSISFPNRRNRSNRIDVINGEEEGLPNSDSGNNNSERKVSAIYRFSPKVARSYSFPFLLLGLFICCTAPIMILFVLDWAIADFNPGPVAINFITPLPLVYCVISPIMLTRRLSAMRNAVQTTLSFTWVKGSWNRITRPKSSRRGCGSAFKRGSVVSGSRNSEDKIGDSKHEPTPV